jgi:hypothetical protein
MATTHKTGTARTPAQTRVKTGAVAGARRAARLALHPADMAVCISGARQSA